VLKLKKPTFLNKTGGVLKMLSYSDAIENRFSVFKAYSNVIASHGHDFIEFAYVMQGAMEHRFNEETKEIANTGDYYIVDYDSVHSYSKKSAEKLVVVNFLFYPDFIERVLTGYKSFDDILNTYSMRFSYKTLHSSPTGKVLHDDDGRIGEIVKDIVREYNIKNYGYLEYIRCRLIEILIITMQKIGGIQKNNEYSDVVTEIIKYTKEKYNEKIKLDDLAKKYNYSLSSISKKFKDEMGIGFAQYLQRIRIEKSCRLLETTELSVREIASEVGYDDVKFFRETFKSIIKHSPKEFRRLQK
jgi:YesN/AraC family two-component response regulator